MPITDAYGKELKEGDAIVTREYNSPGLIVALHVLDGSIDLAMIRKEGFRIFLDINPLHIRKVTFEEPDNMLSITVEQKEESHGRG